MSNQQPSRRARLRVVGSTLSKALGLPDGAIVHYMETVCPTWPPAFELVISHDSLPIVNPGETLPFVECIVAETQIKAAFRVPGEGVHIATSPSNRCPQCGSRDVEPSLSLKDAIACKKCGWTWERGREGRPPGGG